MAKKAPRVPKYRLQKSRGLAVVTINGKDIYLGEYDSPESHQKYDRIIVEWLLHRQLPTEKGRALTVCELMAAFLKYAQGYYVKDGSVTSEFGCITAALKPLRCLYEATPVDEFGPKALKAVREQMIRTGAARTYINSQVKRMQRMFKWGVSEELVPAEVYQALATVTGLRKGRTEAVEKPPVPPVSDSIIDVSLPHLPPVVGDMVRLQRLCGARPGEVTSLRPADINRTPEIWEYRPGSHKSQHCQKQRIIFFGPQAQLLLKPYLSRPDSDYCFSPIESEELRRRRQHADRKTPVHYGNRRTNTERKGKRQPAKKYTSASYRRAIHRVCARIGIEQWSPNQIRHTVATDIRRKYGLEAAQTVLGHSNAAVTQIYAERDLKLASTVVKELG